MRSSWKLTAGTALREFELPKEAVEKAAAAANLFLTSALQRFVMRQFAHSTGLLVPTRMPESQNLEFCGACAVVGGSADPTEKATPNPFHDRREFSIRRTQHRCRLLCEQGDGLSEISGDCPRRRRAIGEPPFGSFADLVGCTGGNLDP